MAGDNFDALRKALAELDAIPPLGNMATREQQMDRFTKVSAAGMNLLMLAGNPENVRALLAERDALQAKVEAAWQPISTAPMDGTTVLVMRNLWPGCKNGVAEECNGHNTYVAQWWSEERDGAGAWICYMNAIEDPVCPVEPTHWMPLPAPPAIVRAAAALDAGRMDGEKE